MSKPRLQYMAMPYLRDFKCTCGDCPDSCCIGWDVDIDQQTYERYMALKAPHLVKRFQKLIKPYPYAFDNAVDFARVKLPHSKRCPFLTDKGLCSTQSELGEGYLSNVCATFPRISNRIDGIVETTLTLSCPVAAELVLLSEAPLTLEVTEKPDREIINLHIQTTERRFKQHPVKYFHEIRKASLDIVQNEAFSLNERLYALGLFYEDLSHCQESGQLKEIPVLCQQAPSYFEVELKPEFYDPKLANAIASQFLDKALALLDVFNSIDSRSFIDYTRRLEGHFMQGRHAKKTDPEALGRSRSVYNQHFGQIKDRILTRYVVNYMIKNCFPFVDSEALMEAYGMLILRLCLIELYAAGLYEAKGLSPEGLAAFIQSFAKAVEHHKNFSEGICLHFREQDWFNLMYLGQLLNYA